MGFASFAELRAYHQSLAGMIWTDHSMYSMVDPTTGRREEVVVTHDRPVPPLRPHPIPTWLRPQALAVPMPHGTMVRVRDYDPCLVWVESVDDPESNWGIHMDVFSANWQPVPS